MKTIRIAHLDTDITQVFFSLRVPNGIVLEVYPLTDIYSETRREMMLQDPNITIQFHNAFVPGGDTGIGYDPPLNLLSKLNRTDFGDFTAIIIGNNLGGGLQIAEAIHPEFRNKIIVLFNSRPRKQGYSELGVQHFGSRDNRRELHKLLLELIETN